MPTHYKTDEKGNICNCTYPITHYEKECPKCDANINHIKVTFAPKEVEILRSSDRIATTADLLDGIEGCVATKKAPESVQDCCAAGYIEALRDLSTFLKGLRDRNK